MPTPPVNGAASIRYLTAGTRQPYSIEFAAMPLISANGRAPLFGVKPMSRIRANASANITTRTAARRTNGAPRLIAWAR